MRLPILPVIAVLMLSACAKAPVDDASDGGASEPMERAESSSAAPDISPAAAPGVAFHYDYDYRLVGGRIAKVQEQHAKACEALGITRCRITAMQYMVRDRDRISATLSLKLAPDIARKFGRDAAGIVERAEGMVVNTEIGGEDVGTGIAAEKRRQGDLDRRIAQYERNRAAERGATARAELSRQIASLQEQRDASITSAAAGEQALASTPMRFTYQAGGLIPGFAATAPIGDALDNGGRLLIGVIAFLIQMFAFVLPFAALGGVGWWLQRLWVRSRGKKDAASVEE